MIRALTSTAGQLVLAALFAGAILTQAYVAGHRAGVAQVEARTAEEAQRRIEALNAATAAYIREREARLATERRLEDEAREDPGADRPVFDTDSVRRLNQIR